MYSPVFVEFLGTSLLIGAVSFTRNHAMIVAALAIALTLGGKISGGHFNPAITAWALASGKIGKSNALTYIIAQARCRPVYLGDGVSPPCVIPHPSLLA
jgi:glycerol uptake facilitator-like aquaporin